MPKNSNVLGKNEDKERNFEKTFISLEMMSHSKGVEAFPIGETNTIVFTSASNNASPIKNGNSNANSSLVHSLPPELRSPVVGQRHRYLGDLSPHYIVTPSKSTGEEGSLEAEERAMDASSCAIDNLLHQLEAGVEIIFHDDNFSSKAVLRILEDYSYICVTPTTKDEEEETCKSSKLCKSEEGIESKKSPNAQDKYMAIQDVNFLDVGKKNSPILSAPHLSSINPMKCFSIVSITGSCFDFEASTILEREIIISSLSLILDEVNQEEMIEKIIINDAIQKVESFTADSTTECNSSLQSSHVESQFHQSQQRPVDLQLPSFPEWQQNHKYTNHVVESKESEKFLPVLSLSQTFSESSTQPADTSSDLELRSANIINQSSSETSSTASLKKELSSIPSPPPSPPPLPEEEEEEVQVPCKQLIETPNKNEFLIENNAETDYSEQYLDWCTKYCIYALHGITDTCGSVFLNTSSSYDEMTAMENNNKNAIATAAEGCITACFDCFEIDLQKRKMIENNITTILGSSSQASCFEGHVWTLETSKNNNSALVVSPVGGGGGGGGGEAKTNYCTERILLRNRASLMNAQARRLRRLRNEMTFVNAVKVVSQNMRYIQTTQSLDEGEYTNNMNDNNEFQRLIAEAKEENTITGIGNHSLTYSSIAIGKQDPSSKGQVPALEDTVCTSLTTSSSVTPSLCSSQLLSKSSIFKSNKSTLTSYPNSSAGESEATEFFYDSDPGEVKLRIVSSKAAKRNSRRAVLEVKELRNENKLWRLSSNSSHHSSFDEESQILLPAIQLPQEQDITKTINEFINSSINLIWHPSSQNYSDYHHHQQQQQHHEQRNNTNISPICVMAWVEFGQKVNNGSVFIQPKFMWKIAVHDTLEKKGKFSMQQKPFHVDLLDICRVLHSNKINRRIHAFAKTKTSFTIETHENIFLFECMSTTERDRIVCGLKLVVARLASQLIVGDAKVYDDFFSNGNGVSGSNSQDWEEDDIKFGVSDSIA